jgi:hypothetical protein
MTPKKAPIIGSFLFIDWDVGFNLRPAKSTSRDKSAFLQIEMTVSTLV